MKGNTMAGENVVHFVNAESIGSIGIAVAGVAAVSNTLRQVFGIPPLWTAFGTSMVLALLNVCVMKNPQMADWVLIVINGCILFSAATGMNEWVVNNIPSKQRSRTSKGFAPDVAPSSLFRSWFN